MSIFTVKTADNGGCGECACPCHTDVEDPGPTHLPTCKFADPDYCPPDFRETVMAALSCKRCGQPLAYPGAVFCGSACCARWEAGDRPS